MVPGDGRITGGRGADTDMQMQGRRRSVDKNTNMQILRCRRKDSVA